MTGESSEAAIRLAALREQIARYAQGCGRAAADITLIAVSKTCGLEKILPFLEAGQRVFGENYVQEAKTKWPELKARYPDAQLHLIGPLQSNKAKEAVALFDAIHTLDRPSLAEALAKSIALQQRTPLLFVQVNTGEEPQKGGVAPHKAQAFLAACHERWGLTINGLMTIPPIEEPPSPHFAFLARLAHEQNLPLLSMGMSNDYPQAILLGATHIRVGTALFGERLSR
jgi:PLP dependent protein